MCVCVWCGFVNMRVLFEVCCGCGSFVWVVCVVCVCLVVCGVFVWCLCVWCCLSVECVYWCGVCVRFDLGVGCGVCRVCLCGVWCVCGV